MRRKESKEGIEEEEEDKKEEEEEEGRNQHYVCMSDKLYLIISDKSRFKAVSWGPAYIRMDRNLLILSNSHPGMGNTKASICDDKAFLFVCLQRNDCSGQRLM